MASKDWESKATKESHDVVWVITLTLCSEQGPVDFHFTEPFFPMCRHSTFTNNVFPTTIQGSGSPTPPSFHRRKIRQMYESQEWRYPNTQALEAAYISLPEFQVINARLFNDKDKTRSTVPSV